MAHVNQKTLDATALRELAQQLRVDSIRASTTAGSGHPTSSMSAADLMAVLMGRYLRYDFDDPENPLNDRLVFSKGHASPLLYSMYKAAGAITDEELLSFRKFGSPFQGHPTPAIRWVDVATGSLGQGLPIGVGLALAGKYLDRLPYRVWVLCGDSEMAEGSMWEAFQHAAHYGLDNLVAILDMNRLGQTRETMDGWNGEAYAGRARAFGWHAIQIDGHDVEEIDRAYAEALEQERPVLVIARTRKGRGVSFLEDRLGKHGKPVPPEQAEQAIEELGGERGITVEVARPERRPELPVRRGFVGEYEPRRWEVGDSEATRTAYGEGLKALGAAREDVVVMDGEVSDSTRAQKFAEAHPERYFEMFIAEQQMVATAVGMSVRGYVPFASSFAAFLTRAHDFIRMAAISGANLRLCGSHAGVSIGPDGPSQMGLEDLAMMRSLHGSTVLYPCDANQTVKLVREMAGLEGISFLRTTRDSTPVIYPADEEFPVGGSKVVRSSGEDAVTVVAAGITVHQALWAAGELEKEGVRIRVVDAYSVKPIDAQTLLSCARETAGRVVVVEDHWPEGGLGEAVLSAFAENGALDGLELRHLAVSGMPGSGKPQELLDAAGIGFGDIAEAVRSLLDGRA
ncbi:transketolase [Rubrobacter xylanophilus]|uniref:Transketolase n=1 Tax=Rubrobacter xylanophilus TaxID=49319 RepID=A0A510HKB4_9ACTN|nr:transketolase [Rubrobacter xylanophilus]BBL80461.1 transketolase [Rubrobacter xylanophilus]